MLSSLRTEVHCFHLQFNNTAGSSSLRRGLDAKIPRGKVHSIRDERLVKTDAYFARRLKLQLTGG